MNKYLISIMSGTLLFAQMAAAVPAKLLGPDAVGRPKIKILDPGKYYVFHSFDGLATTCDSLFYEKTPADSDGIEWCRTLNRYPQNATLSDPVPFAATRINSPIEIVYRVGTSPDIASSQYVGWSPKKQPSNTPVESWLDSVADNYDIQFDGTTLPTLAGQLATSSDKGAYKKAVIKYTTSATYRDWYFYYNNKYIALFNHKGGLVALTHTAYGDDMINPVGRKSSDGAGFDQIRAYELNVDTGSNIETTNPSSMPVPEIDDETGAMELKFEDATHDNTITINWLLASRSSIDQPSGLAGSANVEHGTTTVNQPRMLVFPQIFGLSTGAGKNTYVPAENSGKVIPSLSSAVADIVASGTFPSTSWQSQFLVVANTADAGMLISTSDKDQLVKTFNVNDYVTGLSAGKTQLFFYPQNGSTTTIDTNGRVTLSPMHGDWVAAATKYRNWAVQQNWGVVDNSVMDTTASKNIDPVLKKGVYWWSERVGETNALLRPTAFEVDANRQKDIIGKGLNGGNVTTGFHLAGWWDKPFDTNYPQFNAMTESSPPAFPYWVQTPSSPPSDGQTWSEVIGAIQLDDSLVAPYINAVGVDMSNAPDNASTGIPRSGGCEPDTVSGNGWWNRDMSFMGGDFRLDEYSLRNRDNELFSEAFNCRVFTFIDPTTDLSRWLLYANVAKVMDELGANGVYLDSFGLANDFFDRLARAVGQNLADEFTSGVPAGRGSWIRTGYRGLATVALDGVSNVPNSQRKFIAAEYFSEITMPFTDIVMDYHDPKPNELPIVQATFGNYQSFAGQRPKENASLVAKKAIVGRSFVWGNQLGLSWYKYYCRFYTWSPLPSPPCSDSGSQDLFDYTRTLAQAREAVQDSSIGLVWSTAKFIGMLDGAGTEFMYTNVSGGRQDDWCLSASCAASLPRLRGALWSSTGSDEPDFLVLTNTSANSLMATFELPRSWAGAQIVYGAGTLLSADSPSITVAANGVAVYKAIPVTSVDTDADGTLDSSDTDDDNDGVADSVDAFPRNGAASVDTDHDGKPDAWNGSCDANCQGGSGLTLDTDNDEDGVLNTVDNCPNVANPAQTDSNSDGQGDACEPHGLTVVYFNDTDTNTSGSINENDDKLVAPVVLQRVEPNIDFSYDKYTGPGSGVNADYYSARFTGRLIVPAYTGNYTFCLTGDDGVRMWINNVNLWGDLHWRAQDSVPDCATVSLTAGQSVPIKMEFFDLNEEAIAQWTWSWPGHTATVVPSSSLYAE